MATYMAVADPPKPEGEKAPAAKPADADPFKVPDGTPDELFEFIAGLRQERPAGRDREAMLAFQKKLYTAVSEAATKILAGKPTDEQAEMAVQFASHSFSILARLGDTEAGKRLSDLGAQLEKAGKKQLARQVRGISLGMGLQEAAAGGAATLKPALEKIEAFLGEAPVTMAEAQLAMAAGQAAEHGDDRKLAIDTYAALSKLLAASKDEHVARFAELMAGAQRRLDLPGHEIKLEGKFLNGDAFDWKKYAGKVVLVDFWATWCGPCVAEVPNMKEAYEKYHAKGFDILGINLDDETEPVDDFVAKRAIPWGMLHAEGGKDPNAVYYGVIGIPTMILVGRDGKVLSTAARGEELNKLLEQQFTAADAPKTTPKPEKKP